MILLVPVSAVIVVMGSPLHLIFFSRHDKQARLATLRVLVEDVPGVVIVGILGGADICEINIQVH